MKKRWTSKFYLFTIAMFLLGFFNIIFAWLGFVCLITPFVLLAKDKRKTWCQNYCPRSSFFTLLFKGRSLTGRTAPKWIIAGKLKWIFLIYFTFNLFVLFMSTLMVFKGRRDALEKVRFLIAFQIPRDMPQLLNIDSTPKWAVHLAFRVYSMMFTTTVIGMFFGWIFKPRTWCTICPVNTVSEMVIKKRRPTNLSV